MDTTADTAHLTEGQVRRALGLPAPCDGTTRHLVLVPFGTADHDAVAPDDATTVTVVRCPGGDRCWCQHRTFA